MSKPESNGSGDISGDPNFIDQLKFFAEQYGWNVVLCGIIQGNGIDAVFMGPDELCRKFSLSGWRERETPQPDGGKES